MRGLIFTEFLDSVEREHGLEAKDRLLQDAAPPSGGAYTSVGYYDHREFLSLVAALSRLTGESPRQVLLGFGRAVFDRFRAGYPHFFEGVTSAPMLLSRIDGVIHTEVRKLYPDAELPELRYTETRTGCVLEYRSRRPLADFAEGLILGAVAHYGRALEVSAEVLVGEPGTAVRFTLTDAA